jgi:hypothetical protein
MASIRVLVEQTLVLDTESQVNYRWDAMKGQGRVELASAKRRPASKAEAPTACAMRSSNAPASGGARAPGERSRGRWDALVYNAVHGEDPAERARPEGMGQSLPDVHPYERGGARSLGGSGAHRWAIAVGLDHPALQWRACDRAGVEGGGSCGARDERNGQGTEVFSRAVGSPATLGANWEPMAPSAENVVAGGRFELPTKGL